MACHVPEPRKFPALDSCQKRFLWTQKDVDLAPHPVVRLALQREDELILTSGQKADFYVYFV